MQHIFLTHGHFDHILGVAALKEQTGAKVYIHPLDAPMLTDETLSLCSDFSAGAQTPCPPDVLIGDGDVLPFADGVRVYHTPGHTPGSVCFGLGDALFTGDTLFCLTVGRTDFRAGARRLCDLPRPQPRHDHGAGA